MGKYHAQLPRQVPLEKNKPVRRAGARSLDGLLFFGGLRCSHKPCGHWRAVPPVPVTPLVQMREQHRLPAAAVYPVPVEEDGKIQLLAAGSLFVAGMSI